jgi:hypothetical protein
MKQLIKNTFLVTLFSLLILIPTSCKKEGTGGKSTIKGVVKHHSKAIPNAIVYIKYGAIEFPGEITASYDAQVTADAAGAYEFTSLVKGDYYLYGYGYDAAISENVKGGISVNVKRNKTTETDIPVVE